MSRPLLQRVKIGMSAEDVRGLLSDDYRIVADECSGVETWEVWYSDGRLSYPAGEICLVDNKVHSVDEHLCSPFSGEAVDLAESLFQALETLAPDNKDTRVVDAHIVLAKASTQTFSRRTSGCG
jgi:hypothetical protein